MLIDKTAFIAGVLDSGYTATLFCRPRCFGKTLNMTIMKAYFEAPPAGLADPGLFEGTDIWEMGGGAYREHFAAYPVIYLSMRTAKGDTWEQTYGALKDMLAAEFPTTRTCLNQALCPIATRPPLFPSPPGRRRSPTTQARCFTSRASCGPTTGGPSSCLSTSTTHRPWPVIPARTVVAIVRL